MAQHALLYSEKSHIKSLINDNVTVLLPIVFPSLFRGLKSHWNMTVLKSLLSAHKVLLVMNHSLYHECLKNYVPDTHSENTKIKEREDKWKKLENLTCKNLQLKEIAPSNSNNLSESAATVNEETNEMIKFLAENMQQLNVEPRRRPRRYFCN